MDQREFNTLFPGWRVLRKIGEGQFGTVYEIERELLAGKREEAALKVISIPKNAGEVEELQSEGYDISAFYDGYLQKIVNEYYLMNQMKGNTNIVYCDDIQYVAHQDGIGYNVYIKMELLTSLVSAGMEINEKDVMKLAKDVCSALAVCEKKGVIHRDIKPKNIFVSKDGDYKLGDFGIAKVTEQTRSGTRIGTYNYMAPEVYNDKPYGRTVDIYSLGLVMYWLLNERRLPFLPLPPEIPPASMMEKARRRRFNGEPLPHPLHGSEALRRIVLKACAFEPSARFSSAREMLDALRLAEKNTVSGGQEEQRRQEEERARQEEQRRQEEERARQEEQRRQEEERARQEERRRQEEERRKQEEQREEQQEEDEEATLGRDLHGRRTPGGSSTGNGGSAGEDVDDGEGTIGPQSSLGRDKNAIASNNKYSLATLQLNEGEYGQALADFTQMSRDFPDDYRGWWGMVQAETRNFSLELSDISPTRRQTLLASIRRNSEKAIETAPDEKRPDLRWQWRTYILQIRAQMRDQLQSFSEELRERAQEVEPFNWRTILIPLLLCLTGILVPVGLVWIISVLVNYNHSRREQRKAAEELQLVQTVLDHSSGVPLPEPVKEAMMPSDLILINFAIELETEADRIA